MLIIRITLYVSVLGGRSGSVRVTVRRGQVITDVAVNVFAGLLCYTSISLILDRR